MTARLILATALASFGLTGALAQELLPPEKAFRVEARLVSPTLAEFQYRMAPGYVLYQERFSFSGVGGDVVIDAVELPRAAAGSEGSPPHQVAVYRDSVTVRVRLRAGQGRPGSVVGTAQGCAIDVGVCYPPVKATLALANPLDIEAFIDRASKGSRH